MVDNKLRSNETFQRCKICGASALHSNFGAMTCSPCKMFFKRNAEIGQGHFRCDFDGNCEINIFNRRLCPFCRLEKCFASGMQTELIRSPLSKNNTKKQNKKIVNKSVTTISNDILLPTFNLLQADQSILTIDQWKLFSNLMLCYDEHNCLLLAERFISQQNILPIKLRFKCRFVNQFLQSIFAKVQQIFENNPHFISLYCHDRSILLQHQMKYITIISSSFVVQQSHLLGYSAFNKAIEIIFGSVIITENKLFCFDIPFLKLSLAIICFSSFDYTMYQNNLKGNLTNMKQIVEIQDMYIELAWRYLIYVYDNKQAIIYFSNLIKYLLTVINNVILIEDKKSFIDMINVIIKQTEQSFTVNST